MKTSGLTRRMKKKLHVRKFIVWKINDVVNYHVNKQSVVKQWRELCIRWHSIFDANECRNMINIYIWREK